MNNLNGLTNDSQNRLCVAQTSILQRWPVSVNPKDAAQNPVLFTWSDLNDDAQAQPEEVSMQKAAVGGITVSSDLSMVAARVNSHAVMYRVPKYTSQGVPLYNLNAGQVLARGTQNPPSSGGDKALNMSKG